MRLGTLHTDEDVQVAVDATRHVLARGQDPAHDEVARCHPQRAVHEQVPAAGFVDVEENDRGEDDEQGVLDPG